MLKKIIIYTAIYALITCLMSDDWACILDPDSYCLVNVIAKYVIFLIMIMVFDKFIRQYLFKRNEK